MSQSSKVCLLRGVCSTMLMHCRMIRQSFLDCSQFRFLLMSQSSKVCLLRGVCSTMLMHCRVIITRCSFLVTRGMFSVTWLSWHSSIVWYPCSVMCIYVCMCTFLYIYIFVYASYLHMLPTRIYMLLCWESDGASSVIKRMGTKTYIDGTCIGFSHWFHCVRMASNRIQCAYFHIYIYGWVTSVLHRQCSWSM